jgi:hypothetical protein
MLARLTLACALLGGGLLRAAEPEPFTKSLTPEEFAAAGLDKLTPEQRAKLDALVRARQTGAVAKAKEETAQAVTSTVREQTTQEVTKAVTEQVRAQTTAEVTKAVTEQVRAQTTAEVTQTVTEQVQAETAKEVAAEVRQQTQAEDKKASEQKAASAGVLDRMRVVLKPGTEIDYTTLDATVAGPFHGWQKDTVITLTNGQRWVVTDDDHYWVPDSGKPIHVRIVPGILGSFFMEIERGGRPRVRFLGHVKAPAPAPAPSP